MSRCEDCGCSVHNLGCVNCNEEAYIEESYARLLAEQQEREMQREHEAQLEREYLEEMQAERDK